jgi:hypothetical protein
MSTFTLSRKDPWGNMLKKGIVLWRHCSLEEGKIVPSKVSFQRTEKGTFIGRIVLCGGVGIWEPEVQGNKLDKVKFASGIAVFMQEVPPAHWTHLIIDGISNPFTLGGQPEKGGCVFAKMAIPFDMQEYIDFRTRMLDAQTAPDANIACAIDISSAIWPNQAVPTTLHSHGTRLVVQRAWTNDAHFRYGFIESSQK